ncbi:piRNA biogenesis protein EXD1 [Holothuria leucospilota]|uniref:PiRNA biogenesis protein EXD1 n=1 Tax=Holothuria leucospilota TaxID=206669 RepID=A0A9Q1BHI2_HOLLE|nr:piRNA biogenesis protein EXD1 [Holothuria leucospilota]
MASGTAKEQLENIAGIVRHHCPVKKCYDLDLFYRGDYLGDAYYDGKKLQKKLKGIATLGCVLNVNDKVFVTVERAPERQARGRQHTKWIVVDIRPRLEDVTLNRLPSTFYENLPTKKHPIADLGYVNQLAAYQISSHFVPYDRAAELISLTRKEVVKWNGLPLHELFSIFENKKEPPYAEFVNFLGCSDGLFEFLNNYPQYFVLRDSYKTAYESDTLVYVTRRFSRSDFELFLIRNRESDGNHHHRCTYQVINTMYECKRVCDKLLRRAGRRQTPLVIAIDCEGGCLGKDEDLNLLQLSTPEGEAYLFDVMSTWRREDMFHRGKLGLILEHENIIKVFHNCFSDQAALFFQFGIIVNNVFDTSIAFATIWEQCNTTIEFVQPSLAKICATYGYPMPQKNGYIANKMKYDHEFWARRPLTADMIEYATDDVLCLVPLIYKELNRLISPLWRPLFKQRCEQRLEKART